MCGKQSTRQCRDALQTLPKSRLAPFAERMKQVKRLSGCQFVPPYRCARRTKWPQDGRVILRRCSGRGGLAQKDRCLTVKRTKWFGTIVAKTPIGKSGLRGERGVFQNGREKHGDSSDDAQSYGLECGTCHARRKGASAPSQPRAGPRQERSAPKRPKGKTKPARSRNIAIATASGAAYGLRIQRGESPRLARVSRRRDPGFSFWSGPRLGVAAWPLYARCRSSLRGLRPGSGVSELGYVS